MSDWRALAEETATQALGAALARACERGCVIYLHGELGAGKTTLVRGFLRGLGYEGVVKSPTYTLIEPYMLAAGRVYHLDLYRLADPEELEYLGIRDYFAPGAMCLVEWPERGGSALPRADLEVFLQYDGAGRRANLVAHTATGEALLRQSLRNA